MVSMRDELFRLSGYRATLLYFYSTLRKSIA